MPLTRRTALGAAALLALPAVARAGTRRFRLGHNNSTESVVHAAADGFDKALRAASDGRLSIEIVPNSALGTEAQMMQAVSQGTLDMTVSPVGTTASFVKEVGLLEMPFLFRDAAHARGALAGPLGAHCAELLAGKGFVVAAWSEIGFRHVTANKAVRGPADLRGLKIRVPLSDVIMQSFRSMGAAADPLPWPQLPEALRTGRFEAQENPVNIILAGGLQRFQSHLSRTGHVYTPGAIAVSADVLEELTEADRKLVLAAARPGAVESQRFGDAKEGEGIAALRAAGMTIVEDVDQSALRAAAGTAREKLSELFGADAVRRIVSLAG